MEIPFYSPLTQNQALKECCGSESDTPSPASPILPHELVVEILSRLPARTLIKFRCVCKSFTTLISCPMFIKTNLKNVKTLSKTNPSEFSERLLIKTSAEKKTFQSWSIYSIFSSPGTDVMKLDCVDLTPDATHGQLVGSCDGLLCLIFEDIFKDIHVILWNPTTGVLNKLPSLFEFNTGVVHEDLTNLGFGYNSEMDDYVVVALFPCETNTIGGGKGVEIRVMVYSLKTQCWKRIEDFEYGFPHGSGIHVKGNLCWLINSEYRVQSRCTIVALDLAKETFKEVLWPDCGDAASYNSKLGVLNGLLCVLCNYEVWIMTEFGVPASWTKMFRIPYFEYPEKFFYSPPFFIYDGGEVVFELTDGLAIYNPNDGTFRYPNIDSFCGFRVYIESLVSPSGGNDQHF